jgi:hypothetical protein
VVDEYTADFYIKQLPNNQLEIDSIGKERNKAYYQLGVIYKEKFKEYKLATIKLEQLLQNTSDAKWILPSMYNLYKIYQITNSGKAEAIKERINSQFPDSRYAQIINDTNPEGLGLKDTPEGVYNTLYKQYKEERFLAVLEQSDELISQFSGEEIISKFELLKANTIGKLKGLTSYKNELQFVADNYSNSEEGKKAQEILKDQIPLLEKLNFTTTDTKNWKVLYKVMVSDEKGTKATEEKIKKFISGATFQDLNYSLDSYNETERFLVIHGINSEAYAENIVRILQENKRFTIITPGIILSNENYKVIQIKKNLDIYLGLKKE